MRKIRTATGVEIALDGDMMTLLETLYEEVTVRLELERTYEDMMREITHLVAQMSDEEKRTYLVESIFLNTVTYENERLGAYMKRLARQARDLAESAEP